MRPATRLGTLHRFYLVVVVFIMPNWLVRFLALSWRVHRRIARHGASRLLLLRLGRGASGRHAEDASSLENFANEDWGAGRERVCMQGPRRAVGGGRVSSSQRTASAGGGVVEGLPDERLAGCTLSTLKNWSFRLGCGRFDYKCCTSP